MEMTDNQLKMMQLRNYQAMPLGAKVTRTKALIREWYEAHDGMVYLARSGGKDSDVVADILYEMYPDVPHVFADTGNELKSVHRHVMEEMERGIPIAVIHPKMTFWDVCKSEGWPVISKKTCMGILRFINTKSFTQKRLRAYGGINPTSGKKQQRTIAKKWHHVLRAVLRGDLKVTYKCCGELKIKPFVMYERATGRLPIVGTMACDSETRKESYLNHGGCNAFDQGTPTSRPIMFWTEQSVLEYIYVNKLPIAGAYGEVVVVGDKYKCTEGDRTGCKFCLFGIHMEKGENRIQRLARVEPESYREFIDNGGDEVMEILGADWRPFKEPDVQTDMFDARYEIDVKELHGE